MGDDGGGAPFASPPAAKRMKRVAEMVMVLSAMAEMRGGRDPTAVEKSMASEARMSLTGLCEGLKPKDLFSREAVRAVVEDLGLSKDVGIGFKPPRISISEKIVQTKRKLEGPKEVITNPFYPSPNFGTTQIGGVHSQPISQRSQPNQTIPGIIKPGITIPTPSGITTVPRSDPSHLRQNGPAPTQPKIPLEKPKSESESNEKPPSVQPPNHLLIGLPAQQNAAFIPPSQTNYSSHTEISKKVQKIAQSKRDATHPLWTPPSTDYMTKPTICQFCNVVITDVESILICDACEKGTHLKCLENYGNKIVIPKGEWHCQKCLISSQGKPLPPKYGKVTRTVGPPKISPPVKKDDQKKTVSTNGNNIITPQTIKSNNNNNNNNNNNDGAKEKPENKLTENGGTGEEKKKEAEKEVVEQMSVDDVVEKPGNEKQGNEVPESGEIEWVGEAGEVIDGKIHYSACSINKLNYKLQDHVLVSSDGNRLIPSKIKSLWESKEPNLKFAVVNSYYLPNDLPESVSSSSGGVDDNEVYASDNKQVISLQLISGKCEVYPNDKFQEETERRGKLNGDSINNSLPIFLCRWKYDDTNGILRPITN